MSRRAWSMALWAVLACAVFSDLLDWKMRQAGLRFVHAQAERRAQGAALDTIENGFRPLVRQAAWDSAAWAMPILILGAGATVVAARRTAF
jgi:hypothetical protein